jgi:NAD(P)H-hydrate epimerase
MLAAAEGKDVAALGPGLGQEEETLAAIRDAVLRCPLPLVLDADGLNAFAGRLEALAERAAPTVLTPHPGELGRLLGRSAGEVQADRVAAAREAARRSRALVVLKGHLTLVAGPAPDLADDDDVPPAVWVCTTGNPGMASGGSGDVLTGLLAALLGQVDDPGDAVRLGVWLHGRAGDLAADRLGELPMAALDVVESLPGAFAELAELRDA